MALVARRVIPYVLVVLASAWIASTITLPGDWEVDSWPAVHVLASGDIGSYLSATPMMGPFATLVQAPFVALSGSSGIEAYRWAAFPCLLAAGLLGVYLSGTAGRRGAGPLGRFFLAAVCVFNPLTFQALQAGHPEEILTAALAVGAIAAAAEGRRWQAGVLIGLAVASKQWAVIAILPTLMALPGGRLRAAAVAAAVAALLMLPGFAASPSSFLGVQEEAASTGRVVTPWSAWYPAASSVREVHEVGGHRLVADRIEAPSPAGPLSHPLIVLLALAIPVAVAIRKRLPITGSEAMALLALLALLRCALDPVDNLYYHAPLLLALVGWDAFSPRGAPLRSLFGLVAAAFFWRAARESIDPATFNLVYLAVVVAAGILISSSVFGRSTGRAFNRSNFSLQGAPISGIK